MQQTQTKLTDVYMTSEDELPGKLRGFILWSICSATAAHILEGSPDAITQHYGAEAEKNRKKSRHNGKHAPDTLSTAVQAE